MAKNRRRLQKEGVSSPVTNSQGSSSISKRSRKIIIAGIGIVIVGFVVLSRTDPAGKNWASTISPILIVLGYVLIGVGIIIPDPKPLDLNPNNPENLTTSRKI